MNESVQNEFEEKIEVHSIQDKGNIERSVPVSLAETLGLKKNKDESLNIEFGYKKYEGQETYIIDVRKQLPKIVALNLLEQLINLYQEETFELFERVENEI